MAVKGWHRLPPRARRKCGEIVAVRRGKTVYVERCAKRALWVYGKFFVGRCDEHKNWLERIVEAAKEGVKKLFSA